ncbi:hypothetical protein LCGC14_0422070 [marine sediment metagenome]|uniref:Uncharacterized protein n=1 Tax=marine sediment metagenome TaxID=412755 RepID=A0A0F9T8M2_9ZZZZ
MGRKRKPPSPVEEEVLRRERFREIKALKAKLSRLVTKEDRVDFLDDTLREVLKGATPDDDVQVLQIVAKEFRLLPELSELVSRFDREAQRLVRTGNLTILEGVREGELRPEPLTSSQTKTRAQALEDRKAFLRRLQENPRLKRELAEAAGAPKVDIDNPVSDIARIMTERRIIEELRKKEKRPVGPLTGVDVEGIKERVRKLRGLRTFRKGPFDK